MTLITGIIIGAAAAVLLVPPVAVEQAQRLARRYWRLAKRKLAQLSEGSKPKGDSDTKRDADKSESHDTHA